jgi:hypothetical protein
MMNTTGPQRPDRSSIGKSADSRDYPMSTDGKLTSSRAAHGWRDLIFVMGARLAFHLPPMLM